MVVHCMARSNTNTFNAGFCGAFGGFKHTRGMKSYIIIIEVNGKTYFQCACMNRIREMSSWCDGKICSVFCLCACDMFHYLPQPALTITVSLRCYCVFGFFFHILFFQRIESSSERPKMLNGLILFIMYKFFRISKNEFQIHFFVVVAVFIFITFAFIFAKFILNLSKDFTPFLFLFKSYHAHYQLYFVEFNLMKFHPIDY